MSFDSHRDPDELGSLGDLLQESENEDGEEEEHSGDSTSNKLLVAEDQTNYFKCFKIVGLLGNE